MVSTSKNNTFRRRSGQVAGCNSRKKKQTENCASQHDRNGFLRSEFLPVIINGHEELTAWKKVESNFFNSLSNLGRLYGFQPLDITGKVYPYNIAMAYNHAVSYMQIIQPELSLIVVQDETHPACLATVKVFNTGSMLYYVNVRPLHRLLQDKKTKSVAELLLSVFGYLYQVGKMPYYADSSTYLYYCYATLKQWVIDDGEEDEKAENLADLKNAFHAGKIIQRKISNPCQLPRFKKRVATFMPSSEWEESLLQVSREAFELYFDFPERSISDMIMPGLLDPLTEERMYPEQYLSFFWDDSVWLYDSMMEFVNADLQELTVMDEPLTVQLFDAPQSKEEHDLSFAERLFKLADQLAYVLNNYDHEKY